MKTFTSADDLRAAVGEHLGYSDWHVVDQERIDRFADATGDHQWIHVNPEMAKLGPFGTTIAHGYLTLSLIPWLMGEVVAYEGVKMGVNYGCNKVRFPAPVKVNSRVRAGAELILAEDVAGGVQLVNRVTIEVEGAEKPSCVAETVSRVYF
ncbi:MAG TPA: MaoC family dehydratase [Candidatus Angelobacter sp.]|jgi:acyl dehydratase|nr:MaoC family dehydratase [Candidatus Angelobacter sp.]